MRTLAVTLLLLNAVTWIQAIDGEFPDIKTLFLDSYQFKSEITIPGTEKGISTTTGYVDEYFDESEDIGRLDVVNSGYRINLFYNKELGEITQVSYKNGQMDCAVTPWDKKDSVLSAFFLWSWDETYGPKDKLVFGPSAIFHTISKEQTKPKYTRVATVRGIAVNEYTATISKFPNIVFTLHMTQESWTHPYTGKSGKQVPVRITALGKDKEINVNYTLDITNFQNHVDMSALELPVGIGCPGMTSTMPAPTLPDSFFFVAEYYNLTQIDDQMRNFISLHKVWYMGDSKFSRIEMHNVDKDGESEVHDFNTGVMYAFDDRDQCTIKPLIKSMMEKSDNLLRLMKTPNDIFHIDETTYYMGKAFTRGIYCDVFETVSINENSDDKTKVVYTQYFTTYNWVDVNKGMQENQIPVRILVNVYNKDLKLNYKLEYNIFNFAETFTSNVLDYFNVEKCFPRPADRQYIEMLMEANEEAYQLARNDSDLVKEDILDYLVSSAKLSPLRIPYLRLDYEDMAVLARALILERTEAIQSFEEVPNNPTPNNKETKVLLTSASDDLCAQECLKMKDAACKSFHSCGQECYLSTEPSLEPCSGDKNCLSNVTSCSYFRKAEFNETGLQPKLEEALKTIEQSIKKGEFLIPLSNPQKKQVLLKVSTVNRINPYVNLDKDVDKFQVIYPYKSLPSAGDDETVVDADTVNSRFDCYRRCSSEPSISCLTFSMCDDTKECRLSSKNWTSDSLVQKPHCKVYSVSVLKLFEKLESRVAAGLGDVEVSVATAEQCAQSCREKKSSMPCRGFEFCETRKSCVLHKKHYLDLNKNDIVKSDVRCDHYALKFSYDFMPTARLYIQDKKALAIDGINEEQCAKRCSEREDDATCKSFTFCSGQDDSASKCTLYTMSPFDENVDTTGAPANCLIYTRNDNTIFQDKPAQLKINNSGYSPGGLTGLIFGMLFLGLALGAAGFLGYSYYRLRKNDDGMTVRFVKNDNL